MQIWSNLKNLIKLERKSVILTIEMWHSFQTIQWHHKCIVPSAFGMMRATFSHIFQHLATLYCVTFYCPEYLLLSWWVLHFDFYFEYPVAFFMFSKFGRYPKELIFCNALLALLFCFAFFRRLHLFCFGFVLLIFKNFLFAISWP